MIFTCVNIDLVYNFCITSTGDETFLLVQRGFFPFSLQRLLYFPPLFLSLPTISSSLLPLFVSKLFIKFIVMCFFFFSFFTIYSRCCKLGWPISSAWAKKQKKKKQSLGFIGLWADTQMLTCIRRKNRHYWLFPSVFRGNRNSLTFS